MVRFTKGKFNKKNSGESKVKGKSNGKHRPRTSSESKRVFKHKHGGNKSYSNHPGKGVERQSKELNRPEELHSSDSEPDSFTQLVSCFSNPAKNDLIISDEESISEEEIIVKANDSPSLHPQEEASEDDEPLQTKLGTDDDSEDETDEVTSVLSCDPFDNHIQYDLSDELFKSVSSTPQIVEETVKCWPVLGQLKITLPKAGSEESQAKKKIRIDGDVHFAKEGSVPQRVDKFSLNECKQLFVKSQIHSNIHKANNKCANVTVTEDDQLTALQKELFSIVNNYQDLYFPERTLDNGEEVRFIYCLHAINHVLKTRLKVVHHNSRLATKQDSRVDVPDDFRDQGLIRPKVLILVPFRNSALKVVEMLASLLLEEGNNNILNKKRFYEEFNSGEIAMPRRNPKPEDYEKTFAGDTDDNFKIGISVTKKSLKLYADFYSADIIIASPLGLRVIVGAEGQADRDYDFLASIELLVLDQAEVIFMQNWDHLLHIWDHLHMQPKDSHGTNFARVRPWALSGRARYYRQTLVFSSHPLPQISALFSRKCHNYAGKVWVMNPVKTGTICQIVLQLPQVFNRIDCDSATDSIDARFQYFISKVLPQYKEPLMSHTVIYVPSYFDYVRIRNYFKKEMVSFVQICEYSKDGKIARARDMFFHSSAHFLLYSERFHFFRRIRLKGIRHIVFYQPPTIPHFYSELCNLMQTDKDVGEGSLSVSVMYTRYDAPQLAAIVGSDRTSRMLTSDRPVHMFMTGD
ncbi:U3 small nucleolar RNA-associated protein 25 homolog [Macrosteles quadrilineatus]|uniref:U3 small nucleolar RNA-associated protein 25 homolog n=1 Tax=Macrosteles quadrilineatus TaxID=74068 RepID=UPI0023E1E7C6|nr:U3 small nucleolar RNA-associated protein 25 homolog [Macrosteles quadrilineatus]